MKSIQNEVLLKAMILVGFTLWILYLVLSGNIDLYISPALTWLSKLSAILLTALILAAILPAKHGSEHGCCGHDHSCTCGHGHSHSSAHDHSHPTLSQAKILIFCVPLLLGFAVKPQILDSATLANSINTAGSHPFYVTQFSQSNKLSAAPKWPDWQSLICKTTGSVVNNSVLNKDISNPLPPSDPNIVYGITSTVSESGKNIPSNKPVTPQNSAVKETDLVQLALSDNPDQLYNQSYRLTGFVYKDPRLAKNQFVITRFVITCCIVDAQPIGIIANSSDAPNLKADTWVEVEGILKNRNVKDSEKIEPVYNFQAAQSTAPYFIITKLKIVPTPKDPYLTVFQ